MLMSQFSIQSKFYAFDSIFSFAVLLPSSKAERGSGPPHKNFLLSLYEHARHLATLVAQCQGGGKGAEIS